MALVRVEPGPGKWAARLCSSWVFSVGHGPSSQTGPGDPVLSISPGIATATPHHKMDKFPSETHWREVRREVLGQGQVGEKSWNSRGKGSKGVWWM